MGPKYDHRKIEAKWQEFWLKNRTFKAEMDVSKPKYYVLDMFPYPSGAGLHVGHVEGYTATDILARYKRQRGFNVLHPMGWDSFGLPAEQYAVRTGTHPAETTKKNIDNFRVQLRSLGFSYDWEREFATSDPTYYKWTQWIFTKLYEKGLAYEAELLVNYCPTLGTVLANEEVENGRAKEGGYPVEKRPLRQWVLKITAYADRLLQDLDLLDWSDSLKKLQINWIGRSEGATIEFPVEGSLEKISIFTTCPDTLFGVSFMVLAPEHPLVEKITLPEYRKKVDACKVETVAKTEAERSDITREKSGVFTGAFCINPANGAKVPIWISDYVIASYGTGAIMAVPSHDPRDFAFAKRYDLPVIPVYDPNVEMYPEFLEETTTDEVRKKVLEGLLCWSGEGSCINSASDSFSLNGLSSAEAKSKIVEWLEKSGKGTKTVHYKLRDWLFSRQRYWGEPFPILHFEDGSQRVLSIDELPLCPPEISDYKPTGDGLSPLAKIKEWVNITDPKTGVPAKREINTMPQWAGSCWYYLRFCDPHNPDAAWNSEMEKYWMPVDMYIGGAEHAVLHLLYSRFWHKVLYDCGLVSTKEPFQTLRNQGMILGRSFQNQSGVFIAPEDVQEKNGQFTYKDTGEKLLSQVDKMSKSKMNGVSPLDIIDEFGADSLRLYEMFMGPLEKEKIWNTDAVSGCRRFLSRFYDIATSDKISEEESKDALKLGHRLIHGVLKDVEVLQFNTAIAKMMEFTNDFVKLTTYPRSVVKMAVQALMPFAPHIAEELWEHLGCKESLSKAPYPVIDESLLEDETVTYVVQINGKLRGRFELPKDQKEATIVSLAHQHPTISKYLENATIEKVIFVPNKLLNFVIKL